MQVNSSCLLRAPLNFLRASVVIPLHSYRTCEVIRTGLYGASSLSERTIGALLLLVSATCELSINGMSAVLLRGSFSSLGMLLELFLRSGSSIGLTLLSGFAGTG